ncbi:MAG TPA: hypothetical protein VF928_05655 [Usitatibacteraceae bacterium]
MKFRFFALAALGASMVSPSSSWACSSCGCILDSDWASQGYSVDGGLRFDARFDYFNQNQLRTGTGKFDRAGAPIPNDRELQQSTINRNLMLGFDYSANPIWGVNVQLPAFDRPHTTIAPDDDAVSSSRSRSVGDIRVLGRYQGVASDGSVGVQFGLKLPTGRRNYNFSNGPQTDNPLDRGLQPGTGTTDALLGAYHFGALSDDLSYFANVLAQIPLNARDGFKPGAGVNVNMGIRYRANGFITPQLQINARAERRESGANADIDNSGATLVNISPGVGIQLTKAVQAYGYLQVPIYQRVNGLQLEPRYTVSVGLRWMM